MGEVYIARDETLERSVALKILPPGVVRSDERLRRFVTEAKSASSLNHPNIVTIYEIGRERVAAAKAGGSVDPASDPIHYISMELVAGDTLDTKIHHERTELRTLVGWLAQAAEGVAKAHASGIVHRDLKPGNIMVSKDGFAKVLDFGLAKLTERTQVSEADRTSAPTEAAATGAGTVMGTVGYMSPEQVQGRAVDHHSDIFSLGCILYEAATRHRPCAADSEIETMHRILKDKPVPVEEINPEVPGEVRRVIRRCLAKTPDERFQSMKDLAIDLREMVESWESLSPSSPSVIGPGGSGARPAIAAVAGGRGRALAMAAAILIGLGGLGFGAYAYLHRADAGGGAAASTNLQDIKLSILMSRPDLSQEETGVMALSADGRYLAYVVAKDARTSVVVRQVRTGSEVTVVAESDSPARSIAFSRDGDFLYFRSRDKEAPNYSALYQVPSLGGTPRKVLFDVDSAPTFSPDGKQVAFRRGLLDIAGDSVQIADLVTGTTRELLRIKNPERFNTDPDWSPDGRTVLIALETPVGGFKTRLQAIDVATGTSTSIPGRDWIKVNSARFMPDGKAILATILDMSSGAYQIFRIGFPGGEALRLTSDFDGYGDLSVAADGASVAAVRNVRINNLWVADGRKKWEAQPITFANGSSGAVQQVTALPAGAVSFSAPEGNIVRLFRMKADGSDRRALNTNGVFIFRMVYAQRFGTLFDQVDAGERINAHIWRVDPDGSGLKQLTDGTGEELRAAGPDGASFLFAKWEALQSLYSLKAGETEPHLISDRSVGYSPGISNDGTKVMYVTIEPVGDRFMQRVHVAPIEGGADLQSFNLPQGGVNPLFARDDDADVTYLDGSDRYNLMRMRMPAGKPEPITRITEGVLANSRWSRAHRSIAYSQAVGSTERLFVMKAGEWKPALVTEFKTGHVDQFSWAPDEPILYFTYGTSSVDVVLVSGLR